MSRLHWTFIISAIIIFESCLFPAGVGESCTEKTIDTLFTLTCTGSNSIPLNRTDTVSPDLIKALDLSRGNKIESFNKQDFRSAQLTHIQKLSMPNCELRELKAKSLSELKQLSYLYLSDNLLQSLNPEIFADNADLVWIDLANNRELTRLGGQFPELLKLKNIDLRNCNLSYLNENVFHKLTNLQFLYLSGNQLKTLSGQFKTGLHKLNTVFLGNNPWKCDCDLKGLVKISKSLGRSTENVMSQITPSCSSPQSLQGKTWDSLDEANFVCPVELSMMTVNEKPITESGETVNHDHGSKITFVCKVTGEPRATITWKKDDSELIETANRKVYEENVARETFCTLTISHADKMDTGIYECRANNGAEVKRNVNINIEDLPVVPPPVVAAGVSKLWLWVLISLVSLSVILLCAAGVTWWLMSKKRKQQDALRKEAHKLKYVKETDEITDGKSPPSMNAPLLPHGEDNSPKSMSGTETASFSHVDFTYQGEQRPQSRQQRPEMFASPIPYYSRQGSRPGSSQSVFLDAEIRRQQFQNQRGDRLSVSSMQPMQHQQRPPSVTSFTSLPPPEPQRINAYVTMPRQHRNQNWAHNSSYALADNAHNFKPLSGARSMQIYSTLPYKRKMVRPSVRGAGPFYDSVGPRTTADGGSNLSLNKLGGGSMSALDSINKGLKTPTSPNRGKITKKLMSPVHPGLSPRSGKTPLSGQFSFEPIEEVESTPASSEINVYTKARANSKEDANVQGPKYKKKKPPNLPLNFNRPLKPTTNFHQRINEINKSFERPKSAGPIPSREKSTTDSESEGAIKNVFPLPPAKPFRKYSNPEYVHLNSSQIDVIQEEVEGTAV